MHLILPHRPSASRRHFQLYARRYAFAVFATPLRHASATPFHYVIEYRGFSFRLLLMYCFLIDIDTD
jgi:hypothetical protein